MNDMAIIRKSIVINVISLYIIHSYGDSNYQAEELGIIMDIRRYFHSACIIFVVPDNLTEDLNEYKSYMESAKKTWNTNFPSSVLTFFKPAFPLHSVESIPTRSLVVSLPNNRSNMNFMKEFSDNANISKYIWLVFLDKNISLEEFFANINIPFDCEFLVAQSEDEHFVLTEVYRVIPTFPLQTYRFGIWSSLGGLLLSKIGFYDRRSNLQGIDLFTGARKSVTKDGGYDLNPSFFGTVWYLLQDVMNFRSNYCIPEDNSSGARRRNGSWSGVMGMMQTGILDVSNIPFVMTPERATVVEFTFPLLAIRTYIIIKKPNLYAMKWTTFVEPLTRKVWLTVIFVMFSIGFCMTAIYYIRIYYLQSKEEELSIINAMFSVCRAFCLQGYSLPSKTTPARIIWITTHLTALVLLATYSAALTTYLTLPKAWLPFYTFLDFLQDSSYDFGVMPNTAQSSYFENAEKDIILKKIYKKKMAPQLKYMPIDDVEGLKRVCGRHKYALTTHTYNIMNLDYIPNCTITVAPNAYIPGTIAVATPAGSPYRGIFNHKIELLRSYGVLNREFRRHYRNVFEEENSAKLSVSFKDVFPIFCVVMGGVIASIIFFIVECNIYHFTKKFSLSRIRNLEKNTR